MANKDQFDLDIQVKPVSVTDDNQQFSNNGHTYTCPCNGTYTGFCTVTLSCKCY